MSKQSRNQDSASIPFHALIASSLTAGTAAVLGNPTGLSNSGRLLTEADAWAHFRIKKLSFRLHPTTASTNVMAVGWVGGVQDTLPSTAALISELLPSAILGSDTTVPTEWVHVPKSDLSGPLPWYKSIQGTADAIAEYPGVIVLGGTATEPYTLEIKGRVEFKVSVSSANTPAELALQARLRNERVTREREAAQRRVLALLGCAPVILPTAPPKTGGPGA